MALMRQKIQAGDLHIGMYVSELDRPWLETPFKLQGFLIRNQEQVAELRALCSFVYIDIDKGAASAAVEHAARPQSGFGSHNLKPPPAIYDFTRYVKDTKQYASTENFYKTSKAVSSLKSRAGKTLQAVDNALAKGEVFDERPVKALVLELVDCALNNPDVLAWLTRIKLSDEAGHDHCMRTAVWACTLGRHLGLRKLDLEILTQAILLKDVGKTRLPAHLLVQDFNLMSDVDAALYKKYVALSIALLKQVKGLNPKILPIIAAHQECYDGSGFPKALKGDEISLLSIIAGLATHYDNLLNPCHEGQALSPTQAMQALYQVKNTRFQEDLVDDFIESMGQFPVGSIVELNTGEYAVVIEQSAERKLRPRILRVCQQDLIPYKKFQLLDLLKEAAAPAHEALAGAESQNSKLPTVYIVRDVPPSACSVDILKVLSQVFKPKSKLSFFKL